MRQCLSLLVHPEQGEQLILDFKKKTVKMMDFHNELSLSLSFPLSSHPLHPPTPEDHRNPPQILISTKKTPRKNQIVP